MGNKYKLNNDFSNKEGYTPELLEKLTKDNKVRAKLLIRK